MLYRNEYHMYLNIYNLLYVFSVQNRHIINLSTNLVSFTEIESIYFVISFDSCLASIKATCTNSNTSTRYLMVL
jgi:hypothetical protein